MKVAGADEDMVSITGTNTANVIFDPLTIEAGTDTSTHPNSAQVSGGYFSFTIYFLGKIRQYWNFRSPRFDGSKGSVPFGWWCARQRLFNVDSGTYVVTTPTAAASTEYNAGGTQPDPAATTTAGTGMTLQVKVETVGGVQKSQVFRFKCWKGL